MVSSMNLVDYKYIEHLSRKYDLSISQVLECKALIQRLFGREWQKGLNMYLNIKRKYCYDSERDIREHC